MDDVVKPSTGLQGRHEVYSATHIRRHPLAFRMERYGVNRGLWTVKTKRMNAMPGSLADEHHLIPDPWKCGLLCRYGFRCGARTSFRSSLPRHQDFMRGDRRTAPGNKIRRYRNCQAVAAWFKKQA
jgi:hypothetical protein